MLAACRVIATVAVLLLTLHVRECARAPDAYRTTMFCLVLLCCAAGAGDGGIHAWKLPQLAAVASALGNSQQSAAAAAALSLVPMPGHAAAVLGLDYCNDTHQLASASEVSE